MNHYQSRTTTNVKEASPDWVKISKLKRATKDFLPPAGTSWTVSSMKKFLEEDDKALVKAASLVCRINTQLMIKNFRFSLTVARFILDVTVFIKKKQKVSKKQLKVLRKIIISNPFVLDWLTAVANKETAKER